MKVLAFFGSAGAVTAALTGGPVAIVIGNLALLAGTSALLWCTLTLDRVR